MAFIYEENKQQYEFPLEILTAEEDIVLELFEAEYPGRLDQQIQKYRKLLNENKDVKTAFPDLEIKRFVATYTHSANNS